MRVAYTLTRSDAIGGAAVHVRDLARGMLERGHEAVVLVGGEGILLEQLDRLEVPHRRIPHLVGHPFHLWTWPPVLRAMRAALADLRPDLVSGHSSNAGFLGRLAAARLGVPRIFTAHGWPFTEGVPGWKRAVFLAGEKTVAPLTDRFITVSEHDRELALRHRLAPPGRIVTVHNGMPDVPAGLRADPSGAAPPASSGPGSGSGTGAADADRAEGGSSGAAAAASRGSARAAAAVSTAAPRMVMVARFEAQKDHDTLLEALVRLASRAWTLELVGDGPRLEAVRRRAEELGLGDRVVFAGHRDDVAERLARAQLFVLASRWEGFPRSILEAMRAGLPVVASDVGGVSEAVVEGKTGRLVPPGRPAALAGRLEELLASPGLRGRLGRAGRARYEERFTFRRMFDDTFRVYERVLEREPR